MTTRRVNHLSDEVLEEFHRQIIAERIRREMTKNHTLVPEELVEKTGSDISSRIDIYEDGCSISHEDVRAVLKNIIENIVEMMAPR